MRESLLYEAREYADIVYRAYDIEAISDIIKLIHTHGRGKVKNAFYKVSLKAPDNPKRAFKYVIGTLRNNH